MSFKLAYRRDPVEGISKDKDFATQLKPFLVSASDGDIDLSPFATESNQYDIGSCFPAGTPILLGDLSEGPIEQVAPGNLVRSHDGKSHKVRKSMHRNYTGVMYRVQVQGWAYPLELTGEHPVLVVENISPRAKYREFEAGAHKWVAAKNLLPGDLVVLPKMVQEVLVEEIRSTDYIVDTLTVVRGGRVRTINADSSASIPEKIQLSSTFCQLIGLFLAEGSFDKANGKRCGVNFTFNRTETELHNFVKFNLDRIFGVTSKIESRPGSDTVTDVTCSNTTLANFLFGLCGEYATHKYLSSVFFQAPQESRLALLRGWLQGDGTHNPIRTHSKKSESVRCAVSVEGTTSSSDLHRGLSYLSLSCGLKPSTSYRKQAAHQNAPAGLLSFYSNDVLAIFPEASNLIAAAGIKLTGRTWTKQVPGGWASRIKSITSYDVLDTPVYNLSVSDSESYVVNGVAVHNCAGNATADSVEVVSAIDEADRAAAEGRAPAPVPQLSRLFVYSMARTEQGELDKDDGTFIRTCFDVLSRFGICDEVIWPYDTSKVFVSPSMLAMRQAVGHKIHSYYRINQTGDDRLTETISALRARHPVVFGTQVDSSFMPMTGSSTFNRPTGATVGGHAMMIIGYVGGKFKVKNSWGSGWRDNGYCYFTPEYVTWDQTWDLWVPTSGTVFNK